MLTYILWILIGASTLALCAWFYQAVPPQNPPEKRGYVVVTWFSDRYFYIPIWLWFIFWVIVLGVSIALL